MNKTRRAFVAQVALLTGSAAIGKSLPGKAASKTFRHFFSGDENSVTVYHTNDLNGRIKPLSNGYGGLRQIKSAWQNQLKKGLVLDAGGFTSGLKNEQSQSDLITMMNAMGYHAAGLSNRELAQGSDSLVQLAKAANFKLINCNHEFTATLAGYVSPYLVTRCNNIKVGITGVCGKLKGFKHTDPIQSANKTAAFLKNKEHCDLVICLSHLGAGTGRFAAQSEHIDMIISGGPHKLHQNAMILKNLAKQEVVLAATGNHGVLAGKAAFTFDANRNKTGFQPDYFVTGAPKNEIPAIAFERLRKQKSQLISV